MVPTQDVVAALLGGLPSPDLLPAVVVAVVVIAFAIALAAVALRRRDAD